MTIPNTFSESALTGINVKDFANQIEFNTKQTSFNNSFIKAGNSLFPNSNFKNRLTDKTKPILLPKPKFNKDLYKTNKSLPPVVAQKAEKLESYVKKKNSAQPTVFNISAVANEPSKQNWQNKPKFLDTTKTVENLYARVIKQPKLKNEDIFFTTAHSALEKPIQTETSPSLPCKTESSTIPNEIIEISSTFNCFNPISETLSNSIDNLPRANEENLAASAYQLHDQNNEIDDNQYATISENSFSKITRNLSFDLVNESEAEDPHYAKINLPDNRKFLFDQADQADNNSEPGYETIKAIREANPQRASLLKEASSQNYINAFVRQQFYASNNHAAVSHINILNNVTESLPDVITSDLNNNDYREPSALLNRFKNTSIIDTSNKSTYLPQKTKKKEFSLRKFISNLISKSNNSQKNKAIELEKYEKKTFNKLNKTIKIYSEKFKNNKNSKNFSEKHSNIKTSLEKLINYQYSFKLFFTINHEKYFEDKGKLVTLDYFSFLKSINAEIEKIKKY